MWNAWLLGSWEGMWVDIGYGLYDFVRCEGGLGRGETGWILSSWGGQNGGVAFGDEIVAFGTQGGGMGGFYGL